MKDIVALGDMHCGHIVGLTPPGWMVDAKQFPEIRKMQEEMWGNYLQKTRKYKSPHAIIVNGDCIEGKGKKSGGTELLHSDLFEQCEMAIYCLRKWNAKNIILTHGTGYHCCTDSGEDMECYIAKQLETKIYNLAQVSVDGVIFNVKHHIGSSQLPHTRHTAISRERLQNMLWDDIDGQERADIFLRSHVHYTVGANGPGWYGMTLPALQGPLTKFGARRCSGTIDWGVVYFEVNKGKVSFDPLLPDVKRLVTFKPELIKI